jgi:hypothetical protein
MPITEKSFHVLNPRGGGEGLAVVAAFGAEENGNPQGDNTTRSLLVHGQTSNTSGNGVRLWVQKTLLALAFFRPLGLLGRNQYSTGIWSRGRTTEVAV